MLYSGRVLKINILNFFKFLVFLSFFFIVELCNEDNVFFGNIEFFDN